MEVKNNMAALPGITKLLKIILMAMVAGVVASSAAIIAYIGPVYGTGVATIGTIVLLSLREFVEESGLQTGDLQTSEQVQTTVNTAIATIQPNGTADLSCPTSQPISTDEGA
jgi:hypothetical protein